MVKQVSDQRTRTSFTFAYSSVTSPCQKRLKLCLDNSEEIILKLEFYAHSNHQTNLRTGIKNITFEKKEKERFTFYTFFL